MKNDSSVSADALDIARRMDTFAGSHRYREAIFLRLAFDGHSPSAILNWTLRDLCDDELLRPSPQLLAADDLDLLLAGDDNKSNRASRFTLRQCLAGFISRLRRVGYIPDTLKHPNDSPAFSSRQSHNRRPANPRTMQRWIIDACFTANLPFFTLRDVCATGRAYHRLHGRVRDHEDGEGLRLAVSRLRHKYIDLSPDRWDDIVSDAVYRLIQFGRDRGHPVPATAVELVSRITYGIVIDSHRRKARNGEVSSWDVDNLQARGGKIQDWQSEERLSPEGIHLIRQACSKLRGQERLVFQYRWGIRTRKFEKAELLSFGKIADRLGLPVSAVRRIEISARKKVEAFLLKSGGRESLVQETVLNGAAGSSANEDQDKEF